MRHPAGDHTIIGFNLALDLSVASILRNYFRTTDYSDGDFCSGSLGADKTAVADSADRAAVWLSLYSVILNNSGTLSAGH